MGVCAVVKELAAALAVTLPPREPTHVALIQLLQQMPVYFERRQASEWESDFAEARGTDDDESTLGVLIDAIFNFAIHDFYGAFDEPGRRRSYRELSAALKAHGVAVPEDPDLSRF